MARTSATGADPAHARARGFTLVELMVVLVVLGMAGAAVALTLPDPGEVLVRQATRLGTHLSHARDAAVLSTREVELVADGAGWRVHARGLDGWTALDGAFEPVAWAEGVRPRFDDAAARASFRFDPVGGASPAAVVVADGARALRVSVDAHGRVTIDDVGGKHAPR